MTSAADLLQRYYLQIAMSLEQRKVEIAVKSLATGGDSVGQVTAQADGGDDLLGITAFLGNAAPGELVEAIVIEKKARFIRAQVENVLKRSEQRIDPPCKYFATCGGCDLQYLSYPSQKSAKQEMLIGALRSARLKEEEIASVLPMQGSEDAFGYRRRITLHVNQRGKVGFYRSNSRDIIELDSCLIADPQISAALPGITSVGEALANTVTSIKLASDSLGLVCVLESPYDISEQQAKELVKIVSKQVPNVVLQHRGRELAGVGRRSLELELGDERVFNFQLPASSFSQVNWAVNQSLVNRVLEEVQSDLDGAAAIYDLYSGAGNFSLPLAHASQQAGVHKMKITAVEYDKALVRYGIENSARAKLDSLVTFRQASVEDFLKKTGLSEDCIVVADPPRSGLGSLAKQLHKAKKILFISCHLPSFVRDTRSLLSEDWNLESVQGFDMFPQTAHLEILGVFSR